MADSTRQELIVAAVAAAIFLGCMFSPPGLMDDVDAVQATIARNMVESHDWVTARLDGVAYLEKSPLKYWMMGASFLLFGATDWAARLPLVLSIITLCWLTVRIGRWAFGGRAGFYAGLTLATSIGLFLFTRILIPDVILTLAITLALWGFLRALDADEPRPRLWAAVMAASIAAGLLLKGLIAALFPCAAGFLYLAFTRQLFLARTWRRLRIFSGIGIVLLIAAPWHIIATLRNPPYIDFTMHSTPGEYRGFFWFYFMNEHVLRFLNLRHPRDYNTVPRHLFWLFHLLWFFPWSAYLPGLAGLQYRGADRAARTRLLAACWIGFVLVFFSFSTTQEYYSMPAYPAFALLLGCVMVGEAKWLRAAARVVGVIVALAALAIAFIFINVWGVPAPGDISRALQQNPDLYTLSLGHMGDLTLQSFAYLRLPLAVAFVALAVGAWAAWRRRGAGVYAGFALMMVLFFHAARLAMVAFDPYMGSRELARAYRQAPPGTPIFDNQYYAFSSVFWYARTGGLLLNGRVNNLEYGSYAPGAPQVFLDDAQFSLRWKEPARYYIFVEQPQVERIEKLAGRERLHQVKASGGKYLFTNQPL